ncbi:MAG: lytic murein transglycosylase [Alphaproteobacteria bacterium]|nr:lytic murein transglycosylase [Alphaproteobacteria bacterium]
MKSSIPAMRQAQFAFVTLVAMMVLAVPAAQAASCGKSGAGFSAWLKDFRAEARAKGISNKTLNRALKGVSYDRKVIRRDRSQRSFKLSFKQFYKRRVGSYLMKRARSKLKKHGKLLRRIEKRYGVPPEILVSIWGLETNFGRDGSGKYSIIQAIATLSYDCRRSKFFKRHLHAAMRIVQRGDMTPKQMRGGWAGEIGQVQFLPGSYDKYAVDYDGNGRRDLRRSVPDILASTANYLRAHGWKRGAKWSPGTRNYRAIKEWNRADVYARTISVMARKLVR